MRTSVWKAGTVAALAACGGRENGVQGDLAAGFPVVDRVVLAGGAQEQPVRDGRFRIAGLSGGAAMLRFLSGADTVARLDLENVDGWVGLSGLQLDPASRRAFPAAVAHQGVVTVNGVRFSSDAPRDSISEAGSVLAAADDGSAFLFRTDRMGPDLRVRVDSATRVVADGEPVPRWTVRTGDSLQVAGRILDGVLTARTLTLPGGDSLPELTGDLPAPPPQPEPIASEPAADPAPVVRVEPSGRDHPGRGRGNGRGRGKGRRH